MKAELRHWTKNSWVTSYTIETNPLAVSNGTSKLDATEVEAFARNMGAVLTAQGRLTMLQDPEEWIRHRARMRYTYSRLVIVED